MDKKSTISHSNKVKSKSYFVLHQKTHFFFFYTLVLLGWCKSHFHSDMFCAPTEYFQPLQDHVTVQSTLSPTKDVSILPNFLYQRRIWRTINAAWIRFTGKAFFQSNEGSVKSLKAGTCFSGLRRGERVIWRRLHGCFVYAFNNSGCNIYMFLLLRCWGCWAVVCLCDLWLLRTPCLYIGLKRFHASLENHNSKLIQLWSHREELGGWSKAQDFDIRDQGSNLGSYRFVDLRNWNTLVRLGKDGGFG